MKRPRRLNAVALALSANAIGLLAIALALWSHGAGFTSMAMAAPAPMPIAGGAGIYIMPCQLHPSVWGCYLIDVDRQTLAVYEYQAGTKNLALVAARYFRYDMALRDFDTKPSWSDVKKMVEDAERSSTTAPAGP